MLFTFSPPYWIKLATYFSATTRSIWDDNCGQFRREKEIRKDVDWLRQNGQPLTVDGETGAGGLQFVSTTFLAESPHCGIHSSDQSDQSDVRALSTFWQRSGY